MNRFSIRDLENFTGIKAHTIRIWEQRYGILQPKRTPTNIRYYDAEDLKLALRVALLNQYGYKISRIHRMSSEEMASLIDTITDKTFRLQAAVIKLIESTLAMDIVAIDQQLSAHTSRYGLEHTVENLVFEFLEKIGLMWLTDRLAPAQEHLASQVILRKIILAIESLPMPQEEAPSVLLFLPEGEIHEIGLSYVHFLVRKQGYFPIYLGQNSPLSSIQAVCEMLRPSYLYTHLTSSNGPAEAMRYVQHLCSFAPDSIVMVSGALLRQASRPDLPNLRYFLSLEDAREAFASMAGVEA